MKRKTVLTPNRKHPNVFVYPDPRAMAMLGVSKGRLAPVLNRAIEAFAGLIERNTPLLLPEDWGYLADAHKDTEFTPTSAVTQLWSRVFDAHRLEHLGDAWYEDGDAGVAALVVALRDMTEIQAWAIIAALEWRRGHARVTWEECEWWAPEMRHATE